MKKKVARGFCWLLVMSSLLMIISGCVATPDTTDPTTNTTESIVTMPTEQTPSSEATEPGTEPTTTIATEPSQTETTEPVEPTVSEPTEPQSTEPNTTNPTTPMNADHYEHSADKSFQNMTFTYAPLPGAVNIKDQYTYQSLGTMELEEYPIDGVYDQAFNCIKVGDTYKMWWGRACPYDTIWYAESKDMKHWYNAQCVIDLKGYARIDPPKEWDGSLN